MSNTPNNLSRRAALAQASAAGLSAAALLVAARASHAQPATADKPAMKMGDTKMGDTKMDAMKAAPKMAAPAGDLDIVKFALKMEQLESAFYSQVVTAHQTRAYLPARSFELTQKIALAEADHVRALESVLTAAGQSAPSAPQFQFPTNVFLSPITYAWFAYTLEEIGIGAYLGAVGSIESSDIRRAAASIYGAEAQHAALLRTLAGFDFAPKYYEAPLTVDQVTQLITPYILT